MSIGFRSVNLPAFATLVVVLASFTFVESLVAQTTEPDYQFEFIARAANSSDEIAVGALEVSVLPPQLHQGNGNGESATPVVLALDAMLFPGQWLIASSREEPGVEELGREELSSDERASIEGNFVRGKFTLFQTAEQPQQYQQWLDPETYSTFMESVAGNEIDLASDREFYLQYDNIRLLGSIRYGVYTLLYTQFRSAGSEQVTTSVMPVRYLDGRLVTAGSLHASSHELYRMLAFGTLQRQLMIYLEERVKN